VTGGLTVRTFEGGIDEYEENIRTAEEVRNRELERNIVRMRITEVIGRLSLQTQVEDREALEEEFRRLTKRLRELD